VTATPTGEPRRRPGAPTLLDMPFDRTCLRRLRSAVAAHAAEFGLPGRRVEHLVTVAHELAANAIRHGGGTGRLRLRPTARAVYCEVSDRGPGLSDPAAGTTPPDLDGTSGRGLWMCRQLCDGLTVEPRAGGGTTVTAAMGRPAPPRHAPRTRSQVPLRHG